MSRLNFPSPCPRCGFRPHPDQVGCAIVCGALRVGPLWKAVCPCGLEGPTGETLEDARRLWDDWIETYANINLRNRNA